MRFYLLAVLLIVVSVFFGSCGSDDAEDETDDRTLDDDDAIDDDDEVDDDDDSTGDDDDDDDASDSYLIYLHYDQYYFNDLWISVDEEILEPGARLLVDGEEVEQVPVQKVSLPDGQHTIEFISAKKYHKKELTIDTVPITSSPVLQADLSTTPVYLDLPAAGGAGMPLRITVENTGSTRVTDLGFFTAEQPDLRSVEAIRTYLEVMTDTMNWHEKAMFIFNFVKRWSISSAPPLFDEDESSFMPDILKAWGYGYCENQANLMGYLAYLIEDSDKKAGGWFFTAGETEYPGTGIRLVALTGHVVLELHYDNSWHLFDPSTCSVYYDDSGNVLSLSDIETNSEMIMDFCDQDGQSVCGNSMEDMVDVYGSTDDNGYGSVAIGSHSGTAGGFTLDPGDVLDLFPLGYGMFLYSCPPGSESDCGYPRTMGNGFLSKTVNNPTKGPLATIEQAYPIVGMNLEISTTSAVEVKIAVTLTGNRTQESHVLDYSLSEGDHRLDLSRLMDESTLGIVQSVELSLQNGAASIDQVLIETILQFNPKTMPQLTHDQRQIIVDGQGNTTLSISVDSHDQTESVIEAYFFADWEGDAVSVPNDGKGLVRFSVGILDANYDSGGGWASGHKVEIVSDHPGQVEILSNSRAGFFEYLPVFTNWSGPDTFYLWGDERLMRFVARSTENYVSPLGTVTFTLVVDEVVQSEQVQIDFF